MSIEDILTRVVDYLTLENTLALLISITALIVSMIALIFTAKMYLLKSGANIRGSFTWTSSISCDDKYISSLTLENLKDRAIAIFKIYLKLGHNYYIQIDDFEDDPLVIKPFEVFKKAYDPIDFYSISLNRINMNQLIENQRIISKIVLSTSDGKYLVNSWIDHWNPILDSFNNHMTAVIYPMRSIYKDKSYGSNAKYIVELKWASGKEEIVPIYPRDYEIKKFKKFNLTKEALESTDVLEKFLKSKLDEGLMTCEHVQVYDIESWRKEVYEMEYRKDIIDAPYYNWFTYNVLGPVVTKLSDSELINKFQEKLRKKSDNND